jgi:hypothetical protein
VNENFDRGRNKRLAHWIGKESVIRRNDQVAHVSDHESTGNAGALNVGNGWLRKIQNTKRVIEIASLLVSVAISSTDNVVLRD